MIEIIKTLLAIFTICILLSIALGVYACCVVAGRADERMGYK